MLNSDEGINVEGLMLKPRVSVVIGVLVVDLLTGSRFVNLLVLGYWRWEASHVLNVGFWGREILNF